MSLTFVAAAPPQDGASMLISFVPLILMFLIFYFIWFVPIRKKQKALDEFRAKLEKGDRVVTNSGFYGEIAKVEDRIIHLKLSDNVRVRVAREAIAGLEEAPKERDGNPT